MNTKAKSNSIIKYTYDAVSRVITYTVLGVGNIELHLDAVSPENRDYAGVHGFGQRIPDAAAIPRNPETGKSASPQEKFDAMVRLVEHYESGTSEWSRVRESGEGANRGQLFRALQIIYPARTPEQIRAVMDGWTKEQLKEVRKSQAVRDAIATFTDGSEGDAILAELENGNG